MEASLRELSLKYVMLIGLALPCLYYFFYFKAPDEAKQISQFEQELVQLDGEIKQYDRQITEGDDIKISLEVIKKEIKALSSYFEVKPNAKSIEQIISEEARATGISFTSLQAANNQYQSYGADADEPKGAKDYIKRSLIEANFTGTFIELMRFLSYLSRTDRIISLKKIELRGGSSGERTASGTGVKLDFKADFETYEIIKNVNEDHLVPPPPPPTVDGVAK